MAIPKLMFDEVPLRPLYHSAGVQNMNHNSHFHIGSLIPQVTANHSLGLVRNKHQLKGNTLDNTETSK